MPIMQIDVTYNAAEDRIRLRLHRPPQPSDWWFTRRITLRLLHGWAHKLEASPLPPLPATSWLPVGGARSVAQQHALLMDVDAPRVQAVPPAEPSSPPALADGARRVRSVSLTVGPTGCQLALKALGESVQWRLSRHEVHSLLEALALAVQRSGWLDGAQLPDWLGRADTEAVAAPRGPGA